ncbi:unnamed protein product [Cylicostephanus goldi]|uniref:Uncharacterized protein n=1 Tax=Cylicostephanus goldi TaxID=71465 RepID=A0A3P7QMN0_CYLGO|nr:unnamed protein product [Cylicostephanus goldi]
MIEIAASAGVPFTPDPDVMRDDEVAQAEKMLIDFKQAGTTTNVTDPTPPVIPGAPPGGIPPPAPPSDGVNYGWNLPPGAPGAPPPPGHFPPPNVPPPPPGDDYGGSGGGSHIYEVPSNAPPSYDYSTGPNAGSAKF